MRVKANFNKKMDGLREYLACFSHESVIVSLNLDKCGFIFGKNEYQWVRVDESWSEWIEIDKSG